MAENKKSFVLYADLLKSIQHLTNEEKGILFNHLLEYVNDINPKLTDRLILTAWLPIELQLKRDLQKWDEFKLKQSNNGKLGGRPKKDTGESGGLKSKATESQKTQAFFEKATESQKSLNVNVNVTDTVNDTVNVNVKKNKLHLFSESEFFNFDLFEVEFIGTDYEQVDLRFYYEAVKNWSASKNEKKIDWISTARGFMLRDKQSNKLQLKNGAVKQTDKSQLERLLRTL